jgi:hypothetical protein
MLVREIKSPQRTLATVTPAERSRWFEVHKAVRPIAEQHSERLERGSLWLSPSLGNNEPDPHIYIWLQSPDNGTSWSAIRLLIERKQHVDFISRTAVSFVNHPEDDTISTIDASYAAYPRGVTLPSPMDDIDKSPLGALTTLDESIGFGRQLHILNPLRVRAAVRNAALAPSVADAMYGQRVVQQLPTDA